MHWKLFRPETEEEKRLKEELEHLKEQFKKQVPNDSDKELPHDSGEQPTMQEIITSKEQELETLIWDLDNKVRFGQKPSERPGSGAGRGAAISDRSLSQSGSFDESRSTDSMDRPRSRGSRDAWTRPGEDRRPFQGDRDRGFLGSRDLDR